MAIWFVVGAAAVVLLFWIRQYNALVRLRNWIEEAWTQIDVQLKRRYDLIPNLVETVKGYAKHEQETLQQVIEARNRLLAGGDRADQLDANDRLSGALKGLFALQEAYPDLKAHEGFSKLQEQLEGTENKIAVLHASSRRGAHSPVGADDVTLRSLADKGDEERGRMQGILSMIGIIGTQEAEAQT